MMAIDILVIQVIRTIVQESLPVTLSVKVEHKRLAGNETCWRSAPGNAIPPWNSIGCAMKKGCITLLVASIASSGGQLFFNLIFAGCGEDWYELLPSNWKNQLPKEHFVIQSAKILATFSRAWPPFLKLGHLFWSWVIFRAAVTMPGHVRSYRHKNGFYERRRE